MESILTGLITSIIGGADNVINSAFNGLIDMCFNSENYITYIKFIYILNSIKVFKKGV